MSRGRIPAWTWHSPSQTCMGRPIRRSTYAPRNMSGPKRISRVRPVLAQDVLDHGNGVGRRHAVVGQRLDLGRRVDVHHGDRAGVAGLPLAQLLGRDAVGQRAAGVRVRDQHALVRAQDRRGLGHEVHAAEGDDRAVGLGGLLGEAERVADVVGHVLDLGPLVVVGQDDGVALAGERADLGLQLARPRRGSAARPSRAWEGWPWAGSWLTLQDEREIEGRCRVGQRPHRHIFYSRRGDLPDRLQASRRRWPRAPRRRPRAPRSPAAAADPCCPGAGASRRPRAPRRPRPASGTRPRAAARRGRPRAARTAAPTPPAIAAWFSLMRIASKSPVRWFVPPPAATAAFSSRRSPGRRLARVEDARAGAAHGVDVAGGRRRHAGEAAEEVQRGALAGEQRGGRALDVEYRAALAPVPLVGQARAGDLGVEGGEDALGGLQAEDDPGLLLRDAGPRAGAGGHRRAGRDVARTDVLGQGAADDVLDDLGVERRHAGEDMRVVRAAGPWYRRAHERRRAAALPLQAGPGGARDLAALPADLGAAGAGRCARGDRQRRRRLVAPAARPGGHAARPRRRRHHERGRGCGERRRLARQDGQQPRVQRRAALDRRGTADLRRRLRGRARARPGPVRGADVGAAPLRPGRHPGRLALHRRPAALQVRRARRPADRLAHGAAADPGRVHGDHGRRVLGRRLLGRPLPRPAHHGRARGEQPLRHPRRRRRRRADARGAGRVPPRAPPLPRPR